MLILFDCDGVLVDSEIIAAKVDAEHLAKFGFKITPEEVIRRFTGLTSVDIVEIVEAEIGKKLPPEFRKEQEAVLTRRLKKEIEAIPGAAEMLDALDGQRAVCSNSETYRLELTLQGTGLWDRFAPNIWSAVEVGTRKPKPDPNIYLYAMEQMGADPRDTMIIEDSIFGVAAGRAAGARVVGFTGGKHAWPGLADRLIEAGAETVTNKHSDIPKLAEAFAVWDGIAD